MAYYISIFLRFWKSLGCLFVLCIAAASLYAMDAKKAVQTISPVLLRLKPITRLPASNIDKALLAVVDSLVPLREMLASDSAFLPLCSQILKNMCSFEFLDAGDLLGAVNELNAFLYVMRKDPGLSLHCVESEYNDFRERVGKLLKNAAELAYAISRKNPQNKAKLKAELAKQVKALEDEVRELIAQGRYILKRYSKLVTDHVEQKYQPLGDFLAKVRVYKEFKKSIKEAPKSEAKRPAVSYAAAAGDQAKIQKEQQEKLRMLLEAAQTANRLFDSTKPALCRSLGDLNNKVFLLHNHAICKPMNLVRLDDPIVIYSFFHLLAGAPDSPLRSLVDVALRQIPRELQAKLRMILQRYICEAHDVQEVAQAAKGRIWEIAVALFLKDKDILRDLGRDVSQAGKKFAREFDVSFSDPEILADCKAIVDWNYWYPKDELANPDTKNKKVRQINDQAKIAKSLDKACVIISKYPIPEEHKAWLGSNAVYFVTPEEHVLSINLQAQAPVSISFEDLYKLPYFFPF